MNDPHANPGTLLDAYLDGDLSPAQRADFERRAETDDALRCELELQRRIDDRLRVLMEAPPHAPALEPPAADIPPRRLFGRQWMAIAAAIVLAVLGVWAGIVQPWNWLLGSARSDIAADTFFNRTVASGLKPLWVCESDEVFKDYTQKRLGVSFTVKPAKGVELVGWNYTSGLLDATAQILLARVDGKPDIVVIGPLADDRRMFIESSTTLRLHRKAWGGLVFYEINDRDDAPITAGLRGPGCGG